MWAAIAAISLLVVSFAVGRWTTPSVALVRDPLFIEDNSPRVSSISAQARLAQSIVLGVSRSDAMMYGEFVRRRALRLCPDSRSASFVAKSNSGVKPRTSLWIVEVRVNRICISLPHNHAYVGGVWSSDGVARPVNPKGSNQEWQGTSVARLAEPATSWLQDFLASDVP